MFISMLNHNSLMKTNLLNSLNFITWLSQSSSTQNKFWSPSYTGISLDTTFDLCQKIGPATFLWQWHSRLEQNPKWFWCAGVKGSYFLEALPPVLSCALHKPRSPLSHRIYSSQRLIADYPVPCDLRLLKIDFSQCLSLAPATEILDHWRRERIANKQINK